jgi:hypothetical protein
MRTKLFLLAFLALTIGAGAQKSKPNTAAKDAIDYAVSLDFSTDPAQVRGVDKPAYVYLSPVVGLLQTMFVNMYPNYEDPRDIRQFVVASGNPVFQVQYSTRYERSAAVNVAFTFEEGKVYLVDGKVEKGNKVDFFSEEVTDPERIEYARQRMNLYDRKKVRARQAKYLEYSEEHPARLDGVWVREKKSKNDPYLKFTFNGDRITYEGTYNVPGTFIAEGRLYYNENTIIMIPLRATRKGKEVKKFDRERSYIWYYKMEGGQLNLVESDRRFQSVYVWENTGEFTKTR